MGPRRDSGLELLRGYAAGRIDREALEIAMVDWMFASVEDEALDVGDEETRLTLAVARFVCGTDRPALEFDTFVRKVLICAEALMDSAQVLFLLPLIEFEQEFCRIASQYAQNVISRTGYLSHVVKRYGDLECRSALEQHDPQELLQICAFLSADDFVRAWSSLAGHTAA